MRQYQIHDTSHDDVLQRDGAARPCQHPPLLLAVWREPLIAKNLLVGRDLNHNKATP
jgi:hypothetical protein